MSASHTPEPWRLTPGVDYTNRPVHIEAGHGSTLCGVALVGRLDMEYERRVENARRILACVNACAGIPTEALEEALDVDEGERMSHLAIVEAGLGR